MDSLSIPNSSSGRPLSAIHSVDGELISFRLNDLLDLGSVGKGACGVVRRALHMPSLRIVASKQINIFDNDKRHQLIKELKALGAVHSPYIVGFMSAFYNEGSITLLLEYANRHSLLEMLKQHGPFDELLLSRVALHTFRGLELLHQSRVVHRGKKNKCESRNVLVN
jgi:serine/threonine protein kinase